MDMRTAYTQVRMMKNFFRAFEQIEEVIATALSVEDHISSMKSDTPKMQKHLDELKSEIRVLEGRSKAAEAESLRILYESELSVSTVRSDADKKIELIRVETEDAIAVLGDELAVKQKDHGVEVSRMDTVILGLTKETSDLQDGLRDLKRLIEPALG